MKNKVVIALLLVILAISASLLVQNRKLNKKVDELTRQNDQIKNSQQEHETKPANPAGVSPFDKPNVDPLAGEFTPTSSTKTSPTTISFDRVSHDFGRINEGDKVKTKFKFANTGDKALLILHAQASCGCTVPNWPRDPITPGKSGEISVEFDSRGKHGEVTKTITVSTNSTVPLVTLTIKATVIPIDK